MSDAAEVSSRTHRCHPHRRPALRYSGICSPADSEPVEQDGQRAVLGLCGQVDVAGHVGGGHEQGADGGQIDVGADRTGLLGAVQQAADGSAQPVGRSSGGTVPLATGVQEGSADRDLGGRLDDEVAEEPEEGGTGVRRFEQSLGLLAEAVEPAGEDGLQKDGLAREVPRAIVDELSVTWTTLIGRRWGPR